MTRLSLSHAVATLLLLGSLSVPTAALAQTPPAHQHGAATTDAATPTPAAVQPPSAAAQPQAPQAAPAKPSIEELTAAMNTAIGPAKIEAMAALLNAMVAEQKACKAKMAAMMSGKR